jgi:hypothetical protein
VRAATPATASLDARDPSDDDSRRVVIGTIVKIRGRDVRLEMTSSHHRSRIAEWADLVGAEVPEAVAEAAEESPDAE